MALQALRSHTCGKRRCKATARGGRACGSCPVCASAALACSLPGAQNSGRRTSSLGPVLTSYFGGRAWAWTPPRRTIGDSYLRPTPANRATHSRRVPPPESTPPLRPPREWVIVDWYTDLATFLIMWETFFDVTLSLQLAY